MRIPFSIFVLLASGVLAVAGNSLSKPVLTFSLTATNRSFSQRLDSGLILRVERDELGWEVGVFQPHSTDSLLYPQLSWHGAFPCQLSAWSQRSQTFPDERIVPIRGHNSSVRIRLIDAKVIGESGSERFTDGRVEVFYKR